MQVCTDRTTFLSGKQQCQTTHWNSKPWSQTGENHSPAALSFLDPPSDSRGTKQLYTTVTTQKYPWNFSEALCVRCTNRHYQLLTHFSVGINIGLFGQESTAWLPLCDTTIHAHRQNCACLETYQNSSDVRKRAFHTVVGPSHIQRYNHASRFFRQ